MHIKNLTERQKFKKVNDQTGERNAVAY